MRYPPRNPNAPDVEPYNFRKRNTPNTTRGSSQLSAYEKALQNIKAHQAKFRSTNSVTSYPDHKNSIASDPGAERSSNSSRSNSIATVASDPGAGRSSFGSFPNLSNGTRRYPKKIFWELTPSRDNTRGGKRRNKKTRRNRF